VGLGIAKRGSTARFLAGPDREGSRGYPNQPYSTGARHLARRGALGLRAYLPRHWRGAVPHREP